MYTFTLKVEFSIMCCLLGPLSKDIKDVHLNFKHFKVTLWYFFFIAIF